MHSRLPFLVGLALVAATAPAHADERPAPSGTRSYLVDAAMGVRRGEQTLGWNARFFGGAVPWRNLVPSRTDRSMYLAIGMQAGLGRIEAGDKAMVPTFNLGPEARLGLAWGTPHRLDAHGYLAVSPMWTHIDRRDAMPASHHVGVRVAMGITIPRLRRASVLGFSHVFDEGDDPPDFGSASGPMSDYALLFRLAGAVVLFFVPDAIELTYERTAGMELTGVALGYSL